MTRAPLFRLLQKGSGAFSVARPPRKTALSQTRKLLPSLSSFQNLARQFSATSRPIDFDVASKITGDENQTLTVKLKPGQGLRTESDTMLGISADVKMNATTISPPGIFGFIDDIRVHVSDYTYTGDKEGTVKLGEHVIPCKISRLSMSEYGGKIYCEPGALLCASQTVGVSMKKFQRFFRFPWKYVVTELAGEGNVFLRGGGSLTRTVLKGDEKVSFPREQLVAFSQEVDFDYHIMKGASHISWFSTRPRQFLATLTGPGIVWQQEKSAQQMLRDEQRLRDSAHYSEKTFHHLNFWGIFMGVAGYSMGIAAGYNYYCHAYYLSVASGLPVWPPVW